MGDGATAGHITVDVRAHCKTRPEGAQGDCYRFTYDAGPQLWAGVYWVHPANNWGSREGRHVDPVFSRIRFYAATNLPELDVQFISGGIRDRKLPYADQYRVSTIETLTPEWQQFSLDLTGLQYDSVIGAFAWVTGHAAGTDPGTAPSIVLYMDDIIWE